MKKFTKILSTGLLAGSLLLSGVSSTFAATYKVKSGDYLGKIALTHHTNVNVIKKMNHLHSDFIRAGQILAIPGKSSSYHATSHSNSLRYSMTDVNLIAKLVKAEAGGESYKGKVAVAAVVINRKQDRRFPKSIRGVIYQRNAFTPVNNGAINKTADYASRQAAIAAAKGSDPTRNAIYFYNPRYSNSWIKSRPITIKIGHHTFAK